MTLNRRQFLGASALVAGALVMTPFGPVAMAAPPVDPPIDVGTVSGADGVLDAFLAGLAPYVADQALRKVTITRGTYKRTRPIVVPSGVHLVATGSTFILQTKGKEDALLRIEYVNNVTIDGGTWDGNKKIVKAKTEWRHAIRLWGAQDVTLQNLIAQNAKGDGIYVGVGAAPCRNVVVYNVRATKNARCGLAITACDGFYANASYFNSNSGEAPEAGVVIEPHDYAIIDNITFANCQFNGNASRGFHVVMHQTSAYPTGNGILVDRCTMIGNGKKTKDQSTGGIVLLRPRKVTISNCYSSLNQSGVYILGKRTGDTAPLNGDVVIDKDTRVTGNRKDGVLVQNAIASLVVDHSRIWNNSKKKKYAYDGMRIKQGANVKVTGSAITSKHRYGVYTDKGVTGVVLTGNVITGNKKGATRGPGITVVPV